MPDQPDILDAVHQAAIIRAGDTLVLCCPRIDAQHAANIRQETLWRLPALAEVIVITANQLAVYRPDPVTPSRQPCACGAKITDVRGPHHKPACDWYQC